nr:LacI family DNA-binding transcriptional regulator [uncultured Merdimonas sp.]
MKATIKDVAKYAGVSTATVSRMLNQTGTVSPQAQERIQKAIEALDFQLNSRAQNFKTGKTNAIAVIVPDISNPFFACVIHEIESVLSRHNYTLMIASTEETREREAQILRYISKGSADGVILASAFQDYNDLKPFIPQDIPVVFFDRKLRNCPHDMVTESDTPAICQTIRELTEKGCRKIGCIAGLPDLSTTADRVKAYRTSLASAGLTPDESLIFYASSVYDSGYSCTESLLSLGCTALVVVSNSMTRGCLSYLLQHGKIPGKDIIVAGYHNPDFLNIDMLRIELPYQDLGRRAAEFVLERIQNPTLPVRQIELTAPLLSERSDGAYLNQPGAS